MIQFLLTTWWIYVPIILILVFLTFKNNVRVKSLQREHELKKLSPAERQQALRTSLKRKPSRFEALTAKYGLRGIFSHIFTKK